MLFVVAVDVLVTTDPDAANWLAPSAEIIDTSDLKPDAIVDKILNLYTITKN